MNSQHGDPSTSPAQPVGEPASSQGEELVVRFFGRESMHVDALLEPAIHLIHARDTTRLPEARLRALGGLFAGLDQIYAAFLPGLSDDQTADEETRTRLQLTMPSYAEHLLDAMSGLWRAGLAEMLAHHGLSPVQMGNLPDDVTDVLDDFYMRSVYPLLTPLAVDSSHPFPHISSGSLNLLIELRSPSSTEAEDRGRLFARVKVPTVKPIVVELGEPPVIRLRDQATSFGNGQRPAPFVWCGDLVRHFCTTLFTGMVIAHVYLFRLVRAGPPIRRELATKGAKRGRAMQRELPTPPVVRLDVEKSMPQSVVQWLSDHVGAPAYTVVRSDLVLELACLPPLLVAAPDVDKNGGAANG